MLIDSVIDIRLRYVDERTKKGEYEQSKEREKRKTNSEYFVGVLFSLSLCAEFALGHRTQRTQPPEASRLGLGSAGSHRTPPIGQKQGSVPIRENTDTNVLRL